MSNTFSIAGRCARTNMLGVAIASRAVAVGSSCVFVRANVAAIVTQGVTNPYLALDLLSAMSEGIAAETAVAPLLRSDPGRDVRQISVVDVEGSTFAYTGSLLPDWRGHKTANNVSVAGNLLTGEATINAMHDKFQASTGKHLAERLLSALEAGQAAGGDRRGQQSAALYVVSTELYPDVDLRVDEHEQPLVELRRIWELYKVQLPYHQAVRCTKANPPGVYDLARRAQLRKQIPM